ncbi:phage tail tape measure protein [Pseudooceanicola sediminis]|uniref:Phage tail tape measure protein n=1 Tax=Pseudooceanicola sediminis TaxID=2211117 RepID=A0A399J2W9_9RHOB|nr:phage tail tape measure protein [Pseudooceanicola sediminis]KAA2317407.1 phage tail tape measure protein [Puniceibacterium sp. HSS470]RII39758.1 phage tail tape measure protein [Pseudooceanicola sediminis]|tara:strand:- start:9003 stop:9668 length:666 start_codon:yes stop_codon:yes gene_type:complete
MDDLNGFEDLQAQAEALDASLGGAAGMAAGFDGELQRMRSALSETGKEVQILERGLGRGLRRALDGVLLDGGKLSDALQTMRDAMVNSTYSAAVRPVTDHFGGLMAQGIGALMQGALPFANGASFSQGRVQPFARGGVVSAPTIFPMRGGTGLMGEAGPEAIMPLARGADGRLGVRSDTGGVPPVNVVINISTPDIDGFRRSQSQIAAQMGRALSRGQRNR